MDTLFFKNKKLTIDKKADLLSLFCSRQKNLPSQTIAPRFSFLIPFIHRALKNANTYCVWSTLILPLFTFSFGALNAQRVIINFNNNLKSAPNLTLATLKYDKDFAYSFTFDDASEDPYTCALPIFNGGFVKGNGATYSGLYYSDGCGNQIPFSAGLAWNSDNRLNQDIHVGNVAGQMTWDELNELIAKNWDVFNHTFSHLAASEQYLSPADYNAQISLNEDAIQKKTTDGFRPPLFVVPTGDTNYYQYAYAQGYKAVFNQNGNDQGLQGLNVDADVDFSKPVFRGNLAETVYNGMFDNVCSKSSAQNHIWYNEFCHRIDNFSDGGLNFYGFLNYMQTVAQKYGAQGTDKMWMAPLQEVSEYLTLRKTIRYSAQVSGNKLIIDFDASQVPTWLKRRAITFKFDGTDVIQSINFPNGGSGSFNNYGKRIINIDLKGVTQTVFDCPTLKKNIGDVCDDGDPNTNSDIIHSDCTCKGTSIKKSELSIKLSTSVTSYTTNSAITAQITLQNETTTDYSDIKLQFPFPKGVVINGSAQTSIGSWQEYCADNVRCFLWNIPILSAKSQATLNLPIFMVGNDASVLFSANILGLTPTVSPPPTANLILPLSSVQQSANNQQLAIINEKEKFKIANNTLLSIFPNPTDETVSLVFKSTTIKQIGLQCYNMNGKVLYQQKVNLHTGSNSLDIDVSEWKSGTYFIFGGTNYSATFVKQ